MRCGCIDSVVRELRGYGARAREARNWDEAASRRWFDAGKAATVAISARPCCPSQACRPAYERRFVIANANERLNRVRAVRAELIASGPKRSRPFEEDFERVALPAGDGDILRDMLVAEGAHVVIE